jgi:hypothetical protein
MTYHSTLHTARGGFEINTPSTFAQEREPMIYWAIERKSKRVGWVFVKGVWADKEGIARLFVKYYRNDTRTWRLRRVKLSM